MSMIEEAVYRGETWMDEHGPADWRDRIDLDKLRIEDSSQCILGQVWGADHGYQIGRQKLLWTRAADTMAFGFNGDQRTTDAWKKRIIAHREGHPKQPVPDKPLTFPLEWAEIAHLHYRRIDSRTTLVTGVC